MATRQDPDRGASLIVGFTREVVVITRGDLSGNEGSTSSNCVAAERYDYFTRIREREALRKNDRDRMGDRVAPAPYDLEPGSARRQGLSD